MVKLQSDEEEHADFMADFKTGKGASCFLMGGLSLVAFNQRLLETG